MLRARDLGRALAAAVGRVARASRRACAIRDGLSGRRSGLPLPFFRRTLRWLRRHAPRGRRRAVALACDVRGRAASPWATRRIRWGFRESRLSRCLAGGRSWPDAVEVRVLDVGQGSAVLVRTPEHHALLFDGGPAGCGLADQLRSLGVRKLDVVVVSHPHADHFAGLLESHGGAGGRGVRRSRADRSSRSDGADRRGSEGEKRE